MINFENDRWMDVNVVGSLLKLFFRKLPEPLMSYELYDLAIQISRISDHEKKLLKLKSLLVELPITNRETFKFLANHLHRIAENEPENKMNAHNLAIMFGPSLVHPQSDDPQNELTNQMIADMNLQTHIVELIIIYVNF
ncbi:hypothetical protein HELRODRAFT_74384 [Helobdella robusta]|uniref:Rho-GAP domain-containing protein n=1 Tax=Helobdella robusta TaxID=6412 RepID=T1G1Q4_HELRO|nr:hypothetical protein HELRODRAFT_74384 [Helobdella robusta]ESO08898.1 hypothetical protein HELRODRAFT_74384 [Helobdella robusta]